MLHGQAGIVAAFPLVKILLSALSRNENARDHSGPGVFVLSVLPVGFRPQISSGRRSSGGFEPGVGLITNPRRLEGLAYIVSHEHPNGIVVISTCRFIPVFFSRDYNILKVHADKVEN